MAKRKVSKKSKKVKSKKKSSARKTKKSAAKKSTRKSTPERKTKSVKKTAKAKRTTKKAKTSKRAVKKSKKKAAKKKRPVAKKAKKKAAPVKKRKAKSVSKKSTRTAKAPSQNKRSSRRFGARNVNLAPDEKPVPKTRLKDKELKEFEQLLLKKRAELIGDVAHLTHEALGNEHTDGTSSVPLHMADVGTDNWEQEFTLGLIDNERALVREIDGALDRIVDKTYGVCLATHMPISKSRLKAKPWAKYCVEYARMREAGRIP